MRPAIAVTRGARASVVLWAIAALVAALASTGCGGGEASTGTGEGISHPGTSTERGSHREAEGLAPLHVSAGGSGQFRVAGGDNSIAEFGTEAGKAELTEAARTLHRYLLARATHRWGRACAYLDPKERNQLTQLAPSLPKLAGGSGCSDALAALLSEVSVATAQALTVVDAVSLRGDGVHAFLLYRGAHGSGLFIAMSRRAGAWRVAAFNPSAFS
jgi:hypothetical protein